MRCGRGHGRKRGVSVRHRIQQEGEIARIALYAHVFANRQLNEANIQSQLESLPGYAHDRGYQIVAGYVDIGCLGTPREYPSLDHLPDALTSATWEVVVFPAPDWLAREAVIQGMIPDELGQPGLRFQFLDFPVNAGAEGDIAPGMQGFFAEYERAKVAGPTRGVCSARRCYAVMGEGQAPYRHRIVRRTDAQRARPEPHETECGGAGDVLLPGEADRSGGVRGYAQQRAWKNKAAS